MDNNKQKKKLNVSFNNLVNKNKSYQLVITYGLLLRRNGYKENFTPIILIPVKMYCEDGTILFQMVNKPLVNPYIRGEKVPKRFDFFNTEKIDNVYNIDKFILNFLKKSIFFALNICENLLVRYII